MKHPLRLPAILALLPLLLTGCNPPPADQTVLDDQLETLDRAREVEDVLLRRAGQADARIDSEDEEKDPPQ